MSAHQDTQPLKPGTRVVVRNTQLYNGRIGQIISDRSDFWDSTVLLLRTESKRELTIGVSADQIVAAPHDDQCEAGDPEYMTSSCRCDERRVGNAEKFTPQLFALYDELADRAFDGLLNRSATELQNGSLQE